MNYCNLEIFTRFLFFANSVKRNICDIEKSQLEHELPTCSSVKDSVISSYAKISEFALFAKVLKGVSLRNRVKHDRKY